MKGRAYKIDRNPKYDWYQRALAITVYKFLFDKKTRSGAKESVNEGLAQEVHNQVIKKFKKITVYARLKDNIWVADLAKMGSLSSKSWGVKYLLCVIDVFTKYALVKPLKDKNAETVFHGFIEIVNKSKCAPNKLWVDQGIKLYVLCKNG